MPHIVSGALKEYDWGIVDGLAPWHGPTGTPQAELWFGTHPSGPTTVVCGPDRGKVLADLPEHVGMPLVKILAAASPLSIQVHPDAATALRGWAARSPLFADGEEKTEMLLALTPFEIHAGWRDVEQAARALEEAGADPGTVDLLRRGERAEAVRRLLGSPAPVRLDDAARRAGWPDGDIEALARVGRAFPGDPGIAVTALLQHGVLEPGHAIAVPAGVVHSYVGGIGVEVMTTSDNVLRLGLTGKAIAVDEALEAVRADREPERLSAARDQVLAPGGMPFDLAVIESPRDLRAGRHRLVLAWEGGLRVTAGSGAGMVISQGQAVVWAPHEASATIEPEGLAVLATC